MKLWFDEDLSPTLVQVANDLGFEATCNRDRNMLGSKDPDLRAVVQDEGWVLVTDNASDFRPMYERDTVHPGLVVVPAEHLRTGQQTLTRAVLEFTIDQASRAGEIPADFLVNKLIEINDNGQSTVEDLPGGP